MLFTRVSYEQQLSFKRVSLASIYSELLADLDEEVIMGCSRHDFLLYLGMIERKELQFLEAKCDETEARFIQSVCHMRP